MKHFTELGFRFAEALNTKYVLKRKSIKVLKHRNQTHVREKIFFNVIHLDTLYRVM